MELSFMTHMRFLSKQFIANFTSVLFFPCMKSCFMLHQYMFCWECFFTCIALKRSFSIMNTNNMDFECCLSFELFFTVITVIFLLLYEPSENAFLNHFFVKKKTHKLHI